MQIVGRRGQDGQRVRILVIGAGAMGSLFAARFALGGTEVALYGRPAPHLSAIEASGLWLEELDGRRHQAPIPIVSRPEAVADAGSDLALVMVMVKAWATAAALTPLDPFLRPETTILTLQNGLGNLAAIQEALPGREALAGTTAQGAVRPGPGSVRHTGNGPTVLGRPSGAITDEVRAIVALFNDAGIPTSAVGDSEQWIWRKLAVNAAINGPTALAGVPNGAIASDPRLKAAADILAGEVATVAGALGLGLDRVEELVAETARATTTNRSSMLQDLEAGRRTEVAAIYDAMIEAGTRAGVDTPANRVVSALIHAREEREHMKDRAG